MEKDIMFLKRLQEELKTQDTDGQASPRYWVVGDYKMVCCPEGCEDELFISYEDYYGDLDGFLENIIENQEEDFVEQEREDFESISCEETAVEWLEKYYGAEATLVPMKEKHITHNNTMFLTKAEAQEHIKVNHYHYSSKAHTYAMTAWRAPKVKKLMEILESFDWDSIE